MYKSYLYLLFCLLSTVVCAQQNDAIIFGTSIRAQEQVAESRKLASLAASKKSTSWRAKGDQHRTYYFAAAKADMPYRICVPLNWDGKQKLPLVMFLHGAWNTESSYLDANDGQMVKLANQHGYILVSPLGAKGAYGTSIKLPAVFGQPEAAAKILATRSAQKDSAQILSEKDVINVLELVLNEYPVDRSRMYLIGHSMGSGGTWYLGAKYAHYWKALAPISGPFVTEEGYPWENIRQKPIFITEGLGATPSLAGSRALRDWMKSKNFNVEYQEVNADHAGMVLLVLPEVFKFLDRH
jgi:predicted peptidase